MSSHFAPRGPLPHADLRSASLFDADDVAELLGEMGYPCEIEEAAERIAAIAGNDRQALVVARCEGRVCGLVALDFMYRSEEHTSELQSLMRISYAVFCLKKKKKINNK